jgi:hypothetical protein
MNINVMTQKALKICKEILAFKLLFAAFPLTLVMSVTMFLMALVYPSLNWYLSTSPATPWGFLHQYLCMAADLTI